MPMFRLLATSIDKVGPNPEEFIELALKVGEIDLLCYWAKEPPELVARQVKYWQPLITWVSEALQVKYSITDEIVPIPQSIDTLKVLDSFLNGLKDPVLTAVSSISATTGSLIISLAVEAKRITAEEAMNICFLNENFQSEKWGEDQVFLNKRNDLHREITEVSQFLLLLE